MRIGVPNLDRIELPVETPQGVGPVWSNLLRSLARGLRGTWGSYEYSPTVSGAENVSLFKVERKGKTVWFTLTLAGGSSGTISLPTTVEGNTAFASVNCNAWALDGESVIRYSNATGTCYISGAYKVKEGG